MSYLNYELTLAHSGIKGQKHGVRRFQNPDGSLTPQGRIRYGVGKKESVSAKETGKATVAKDKSVSSEGNQNSVDTNVDRDAKTSNVTQSTQSRTDEHLVVDSRNAKSKPLSQMSDAELRSVIDRIGLEKKYKELTSKPSNTEKAKKFIVAISKKPVEDLGQQLVKYALGSSINKIAREYGVKNTKVPLKDKDGKPLVGDDGMERFVMVFNDIVDPGNRKKN